MNYRRLFFLVLSTVLTAQTAYAAVLPNPTGLQNIQDFIAAFLKGVVQLSLPVIGFFVVYSGFLFVRARGNPGEISKARENLLYVMIGATLILGAWVLANLIGNTVNQIVG